MHKSAVTTQVLQDASGFLTAEARAQAAALYVTAQLAVQWPGCAFPPYRWAALQRVRLTRAAAVGF